jgi:hypothetical protein
MTRKDPTKEPGPDDPDPGIQTVIRKPFIEDVLTSTQYQITQALAGESRLIVPTESETAP